MKRRPATTIVVHSVLASTVLGPCAYVVVAAVFALWFGNGPRELLDVGWWPIILLVLASPVTLPGGAIGAWLAIWIACRKTVTWTRPRWAITAALYGGAIAACLTVVYLLILGPRLLLSGFVPIALVLGGAVAAVAAAVNYERLESLGPPDARGPSHSR